MYGLRSETNESGPEEAKGEKEDSFWEQPAIRQKRGKKELQREQLAREQCGKREWLEKSTTQLRTSIAQEPTTAYQPTYGTEGGWTIQEVKLKALTSKRSGISTHPRRFEPQLGTPKP